jgi:uncharacterized membrane protein
MPATGEAILFWERGRLGYNLALTALVAVWVIRTWPAFRPAVVAPHIHELVGLAVLANLCYCAAYLVEFSLIQSSAPESRRRWRRGLWLAGALFALLVAQYWIGDEIYPSVLPATAHVSPSS